MSGGALEVRYRRLLSWFPAQWREYREEEVLAVLMAGASEEGRTRPTGAERWDLMRHGLVARVDALASVEMRRRTATLAACSGAVLALACLVLGELVPWLGPSIWASGGNAVVGATSPGYGVILYGLWLVAVVLMAGWRARFGRQLLVAVSALALTGPWLGDAIGLTVPPLYLCVVLGVLAALAAVAEVTPRFGHTTMDVLRTGVVIVVSAALMGFAAHPAMVWWTGEPSYAFYRQWPIGLVGIGHALLWVTPAGCIALMVTTAARPQLRGWIGPAFIVAIPWMELALLAGAGSTARAGLPAAVALATAGALGAIGLLAGLRVTIRRAGTKTPLPGS